MPCIINSVLKETKQEQVIYTGHSQGTFAFYTALDVNPELASKVKCFIGLGPVISLKDLKDHPIIQILSWLRVVELIKLLGFRTLLLIPKWMSRLVGVLFYNCDLYFQAILFFIQSLCGFNKIKPRINFERLGMIVTHEPGGCSVNNTLHWLQMYRRGHACKFDYGHTKNM